MPKNNPDAKQKLCQKENGSYMKLVTYEKNDNCNDRLLPVSKIHISGMDISYAI
jgi:hypothetical protein